MGDYIAGRTTTTSRLEQVKESEFPTITICMDPPLKPSVSSKYGLKWVWDVFKKKGVPNNPNTTWLEKLETMSYMMDKDFSIKILTKEESLINLKVGKNKRFVVEPVVTIIKGICYKMEPKFKVTNQYIPDLTFQIQFKMTDEDSNRPSHFVMYFTSPDATLNIATEVWPQYLPGTVKFPSNSSRYSVINYDRTIQYNFKTGVRNSSECIAKVSEESQCKCSYTSSLPLCNSYKDFECLWGRNKVWQKCLLQKHPVAYLPKLYEYTAYDNNFSTAGTFTIVPTTDIKQIIDEIDIITLSGLIGSIGGSLGMFFGFSLTPYLSFLIEKITKTIFYS